ncbi:hypothetical protein BS78_02G092400 [Paspalum vaginatum]|nr:hypothetical protein BS78_02G092400 [Paspalum vaginatum]
MNLTTRMAYGMASPPLLGQGYHGEEIPKGYSVVSVDKVCEGYGDLELPILGGDGERRLSEALYGFILWKKPLTIIRGDHTKAMTIGGAPPPPGSPHGSPSPTKKRLSPPKKTPSPARRSHEPPQKSPSPPPLSSKNAPPKKGPSGAPPQPMGQQKSRSISHQISSSSVKMTTQKKLAYDLTEEELNAHVKEDVPKQIFSKRSPPKKTLIDPATKSFFVSMSKNPKKQLLSDHDRTVQKSFALKHHKNNEKPPQLGQQPQATLVVPQP